MATLKAGCVEGRKNLPSATEQAAGGYNQPCCSYLEDCMRARRGCIDVCGVLCTVLVSSRQHLQELLCRSGLNREKGKEIGVRRHSLKTCSAATGIGSGDSFISPAQGNLSHLWEVLCSSSYAATKSRSVQALVMGSPLQLKRKKS